MTRQGKAVDGTSCAPGFSGPLADRLAIQELNAAYGDASTRHDLTAFARLWAEDATWKHEAIGDLQGRARITAACGAAFQTYPMVIMRATVGSLAIDGDAAEARVYVDEVVTNADGQTYRTNGRYDDRYVRQDDTWLFQRRVYTLLHRD